MKIELLKSQPVPCTEHTAVAGMRFDVCGYASRGAVWIRHMGGLVIVPADAWREVTAETIQAAWLGARACLLVKAEGSRLKAEVGRAI